MFTAGKLDWMITMILLLLDNSSAHLPDEILFEKCIQHIFDAHMTSLIQAGN
jgi:hypothetical protein